MIISDFCFKKKKILLFSCCWNGRRQLYDIKRNNRKFGGQQISDHLRTYYNQNPKKKRNVTKTEIKITFDLPSGKCRLTMWTTVATIACMQFCMTIPWPLVLEQTSTIFTFEWHVLCMTLLEPDKQDGQMDCNEQFHKKRWRLKKNETKKKQRRNIWFKMKPFSCYSCDTCDQNNFVVGHERFILGRQPMTKLFAMLSIIDKMKLKKMLFKKWRRKWMKLWSNRNQKNALQEVSVLFKCDWRNGCRHFTHNKQIFVFILSRSNRKISWFHFRIVRWRSFEARELYS